MQLGRISSGEEDENFGEENESKKDGGVGEVVGNFIHPWLENKQKLK